jgi:hypothetical protein
MSTSKRVLMATGILGAILLGAGPAFAQHSGGGGHGGGGGGGAHMGGGGGAHFGGGHVGGGAHFGGGGHVGGAAHFGGGARYGSPGHFAGSGGFRGSAGAGYAHGYPGGFRGGAYAGHGAYGRPGGYYGHGYSTGGYWRGGYWRGGYWPRAYYGLGFSWFLPVLPLAYATYWYGGLPYYYANDVYYTYDPSYDGYVATDPPPIADSSSGADGSAAPSSNGGPLPGQIFMYPKNGQSAEQQATDKAECQQWASQQAGQAAQNPGDYQRAMSACAEGRGYSVQ